jgi:hypothetical protein
VHEVVVINAASIAGPAQTLWVRPALSDLAPWLSSTAGSSLSSASLQQGANDVAIVPATAAGRLQP